MARHAEVPADLAYIRELYAPEDRLLKDIGAALAERNIAIHIGAEDGKLLQLLITLHGVTNVVEIGTLGGYSAIWMARVLPPHGRVITLEKDPVHAMMAREFISQSDVADRITLLEGDAHQLLPMIAPQAPFDMVFIDADKISYPDYLDWAEKNIRQGGLIIADNTLLFGAACQQSPPEGVAPATWNAMRQFNARLADRKRYFSTLIATPEGLSVALKLFCRIFFVLGLLAFHGALLAAFGLVLIAAFFAVLMHWVLFTFLHGILAAAFLTLLHRALHACFLAAAICRHGGFRAGTSGKKSDKH